MTGQQEQERRRALAQAYADYGTLRAQAAGIYLPELALVALHCTTEDIALDKAAFNRICNILKRPEGAGWCRFRSIVAWAGTTAPLEYDTAGPPVFAEWTETPEQSCRLRILSGAGTPRARIWTYTERVLGPDDRLEDGEVCALREQRKALARAAPAGIHSLIYHVFWGAEPHEDPHALRRRFDRFAGFCKE